MIVPDMRKTELAMTSETPLDGKCPASHFESAETFSKCLGNLIYTFVTSS